MESLIVTLDGPAGAGKSSVARRLAEKLNADFLDTGAMYRAIAAAALDRGIDPGEQPDAIGKLAKTISFRFDFSCSPPAVLVNGKELTARLRDQDVTNSVSAVAALGAVRQVLVQAQQEIGRTRSRIVTEGRDQGSVVFPDAQAKFYLDASADVRAQRRVSQLQRAGKPAHLQEIKQSIIERDQRDTNRAIGPLVRPKNSKYLDTSHMSLDEVVHWLVENINAPLKPS